MLIAKLLSKPWLRLFLIDGILKSYNNICVKYINSIFNYDIKSVNKFRKY